MRIMVIGVGGVGGYLAGYLGKYYPRDVTLVARGKHKESLEKNGLRLFSECFGDGKYLLPVTDQAVSAGVQDVVFISVKADQLAEALENIKPVVTDQTILVPVLNGAEHELWLRRILDKGRVVDTVMFITSIMDSDYTVHQKGKVVRFYIGSDDLDAMETVNDLLSHPGIRCSQTANIRLETWEKYIFSCALNLVTAYYGTTLGNVLDTEGSDLIIRRLLDEACAIGDAMGVPLPNRLQETLYENIVRKWDKTVSTSLERDIAIGRAGELEMYSGFLIYMGQKYHIPVPMTEKVDAVIRERLKKLQMRSKNHENRFHR
jgi:2-dehydropantoate 2-reductase